MTASGKPGEQEAVEIRGYEPADEAGVIEVLQAAFGRWPRLAECVDPVEFFRWKTAECPFGASVSLVALNHRGVIGFLGRLPWLLRVQGRTVLSARGVDLGIDPSHRRRGISVAIIRAAVESDLSDAALAWNNPNNQSRPGLMKTERRKVVILPRFVQPRGRAGQTLRRASGKGSQTPEELTVEADTAAAVLGDGEYVSQLLAETVEASDRLVTARDLDYLRWRYGRFGGYHAFRADTGAGAPGIVIFRLQRRKSLWVSDVCELLVAGDDPATKRRLLGKVRRSAASDLLRANFASPLEALRCGFVRASGGTLVTTRKIDDNLGVDPSERNAWALSLGDVDLL
jgi:hypothetical protein